MNRRERVLVAGAAIVGVVALGYLFALEPLLDRFQAQHEMIPARAALLAKSRLILSRREDASRTIQQLDEALAGIREGLLPGETPAVAASELQKLLKSLASDAGLETRSERILPPIEQEGFTEIPIEITLACRVRELIHFLHRLDDAMPVLTLSDLKVRVVAAGQPRDLLTTLTVTGYTEKRRGG